MIPNQETEKTSREKGRIRYFDYWIIALIPAILIYISQDQVFFWDTVQFAGKHASWFYDYQFRHLLLPAELDSGHPPVFGWYIAGMWMLFGKSLAVSHWAMYPFLMGIVWQLYRLAYLWFRSISPAWAIALIFADPVLLGQGVLVSPDLVLLFFFLYAINSLWRGHSLGLAIGALGLVAISTRGMMIVAGLGVYELLTRWSQFRRMGMDFRFLLDTFLPYLPAALSGLGFLWIHYQTTGWIGYHADSPWAPSFEVVGLTDFLRNLAILAWRWVDYGRIAVWLVIAYLAWHTDLRVLFRSARLTAVDHRYTHSLIWLLLVLGLMLSMSFLFYRGLQAHRYLLPLFVLHSLLSLKFLDLLIGGPRRWLLIGAMIIALATGNLWIYPERIAQGWDATLAHRPYYELRAQMLHYLLEHDIPLEAVGTAFPDIGALTYRDLSGRFSGFREKDLQHDRYVLYSNIMNDFSDVELDELQRDWREVVAFESAGIFFRLYRRPE